MCVFIMWKMIYLLLMFIMLNKGETSSKIETIEVHVIQGGSFFQYLSGLSNVTSCNVTFKKEKNHDGANISVVLDLHSQNIVLPDTYEDTRNLSSRLSSLGVGYCGFKITNFQKADPRKWTVSARNGVKRVETLFEILYYNLDNMHLEQKVKIGSSTTINCGRPQTQSQDFCQIYNPYGERIFEGIRCDLFIATVTMLHLGTWRCISGILQSMDTLEYIVELVSAGILENDGWVRETEKYYQIGCTVVSNYEPKLCRMIDPTGHEYVIRSNLATERYTTFQTNLPNKTCGIEIAKPLLEHEHGIWKCIMNDDGYLLNVGNIIEYQYNLTASTSIGIGDDFLINCQVQYMTESCYIVSPNGSRYSPDVPTRSHLGECSMKIKKASKEHEGKWSCFFIRKNKITADEVNFQVVVRDMSCSKEVKIKKGEETELFCKTGAISLQYCWFISPTGERYHLFNEFSSDRVSYSGRGLEYGDCGIVLFNVEGKDYGNWSCIIREGLNYRAKEETHVLELLQISNTNIIQASSSGLFLGMTFALVIIVSVIIFRKLRKQEVERSIEVELQTLNLE